MLTKNFYNNVNLRQIQISIKRWQNRSSDIKRRPKISPLATYDNNSFPEEISNDSSNHTIKRRK